MFLRHWILRTPKYGWRRSPVAGCARAFPAFLAFLAFLAFASGSAAARETFQLEVWKVQPLIAGTGPEAAAWTTAPANRPYRFPVTAPDRKIAGLWCEYSIPVPQAWNGKKVVLEVPDNAGSRVTVYVNGVEVQKVYLPWSSVLLSGHLKYGAENTVRLRIDHPDAPNGSTYLKVAGKYPNFGSCAPRLQIGNRCFIADVFADTSFRKHQLTLETEIQYGSGCDGTLSAEILDPSGKVVKTGSTRVKITSENTIAKIRIPWSDPVCWELGRPYLYRCRMTFRSGDGSLLDRYPPFTFGFREIWREGRQIYLNGHIQRLRTVYSYQANPEGAAFLRQIGYNTIAYQHTVSRMPQIRDLREFDRLGIGVIVPAPTIPFPFSSVKRDPRLVGDYQEVLRRFMKQHRNTPSILAFYLAVNCWCPPKNQDPQYLGQYVDKSSNVDQVEFSRNLARNGWSNVLYYAHAAGNAGDISSDNLYLNFTPLQEREEWLSQWSKRGILPWHAAEFGPPYNASFWQDDAYIFTELMAIYYGDRAYREESDKALKKIYELSVGNRTKTAYSDGSGHGVVLPDFSLEDDNPLYWDFIRLFCLRTNRAFRTFGMNGGLTYFNLRKGYGDFRVSGDRKWFCYYRYNQVPEYYSGKPAWANRGYDAFQSANLDFVGYIGGAPEHTDKTHAYRAGEIVRKQLVRIWDGFGSETFTAVWSVRNSSGAVVARGVHTQPMSTGEIAFTPFEFAVPADGDKTRYSIEAVFSGGQMKPCSDRFEIEVYPNRAESPIAANHLELFDPSGATAPLLDAFAIPYRRLETPTPSAEAKFLIIGKNAFDKHAPRLSGDRIRQGLRVLIFPQQPAIWQEHGFQVTDSMSRRVFLRDRANPAFSGLSPEVLANWRGAPDYGKKFGSIMSHMTPRGPRWTRNMTVAGVTLQIPERIGFLPLMDCEFDLNYSPLLRYTDGAGDLTFCTLDFENRVPSDPAATRTARAVLDDFLNGAVAVQRKTACADGEKARKLLRTLNADVAASGESDPAAILVCGADAAATWKKLETAAEAGGTVVVIDNRRLALEAGFTLTPVEIHRAAPDGGALFRGIGPSLLRWRNVLKANALSRAPAGFRLACDGLFAEKAVGAGRIVFVQIAPAQLLERAGSDLTAVGAVALSAERSLQFYARLLGNLGLRPSAAQTGRLLAAMEKTGFVPLPALHVLGCFRSPKNDHSAAIHTVFSGEDAAIRGDLNPNTQFDLPQGGKTAWARKLMLPDRKNHLDFGGYFPGVTRASCAYAVAEVERKAAGPAFLKLGCYCAVKVWVNGKESIVLPKRVLSPYLTFPIEMSAGKNVLTFKVSGRYGFFFHAELSPENAAETGEALAPELRRIAFYENMVKGWDPYTFRYW